MKEEIGAAVEFLTCLVGKNADITAEQAQVFQRSLDTILSEKFEGHWFPDQPFKGQAYRCIRVNSSVPWDSALEKAAKMSGLQYENLKLPLELTIWVDPHEVCCRFGESSGSFFTIASFKDKENLPDNVKVEEIPLPSVIPETPLDCTAKPKNHRKTVLDRSKKPVSSRNASNSHLPVKGFMPKVSFMNSKNVSSHPLNYFDWNPAAIPFSSRVTHPNGYQDLSFMRRPRKLIRSVYLNDRYHWARK